MNKSNLETKNQFQLSRVMKDLLYERRINLRQLAEQTDVPCSTLSKWSYGGAPRNIEAAKRVADYFEVSLEHFFFGEGEKEEDGDEAIGRLKVNASMSLLDLLHKARIDLSEIR